MSLLRRAVCRPTPGVCTTLRTVQRLTVLKWQYCAPDAISSRGVHALATDYLSTNFPGWTESQKSVREAMAKILVNYPDEYWAKADEKEAFPWDLYKELAEGGWLGICLPEAYGGSDLGISEAAIMLQTLSESGGCMNAASTVHMNIFGLEPVAKFGTEEQKARFLPPLIQGKDRACFGVTEPNTGKHMFRATIEVASC